MQIPSYYLAYYFADFILVTSQPDVKKFINKKRDNSKVLVVQGVLILKT